MMGRAWSQKALKSATLRANNEGGTVLVPLKSCNDTGLFAARPPNGSKAMLKSGSADPSEPLSYVFLCRS